MSALQRYAIAKPFARGGMAELSIARSHAGQLAVVKRMRPDADNRRTRRMFRDEIRITASLCHPNVVEVKDWRTVTDDNFFVMEYVHGKDVRKLLAHAAKSEAPVPIDVAIAITAFAAAGLHHAHELRGADGTPLHIVHRDVSPTNIIVGYNGAVKVIDFGIAKASFTREEPDLVKGKSSYMSPEQCLARSVDRRTDIFSLGVVLYELVTTSRLFKGSDDLATMRQIAFGQVPLPSLRRPEVTARLEAVMLRALAQDPDERWQTADDFRNALLECLTVPIWAMDDVISATMRLRFDEMLMPWSESRAPTAPPIVEDTIDLR